EFTHEAYGDLDAFTTILGGKGGDIFNVWETGSADPLILDGQGGSDVYNINGYDPKFANSTLLTAEIEDANVTTTGNVTTSSGVTTITGLADTKKLFVGEAVSGTGIADGTIIKSVDSGSQVTLSNVATQDGTKVTLTFNASNAWDKDQIVVTGALNHDNTMS